MRVWIIAIVVLSVGVGLLCAADLPATFSQSYGPAVGKLQKMYTHATVRGTILREYPQEKRSTEQTYLFRAAGKKLRLDVTTKSSRENDPGVGSKDVYLATPGVSFSAHGGPQDPSVETMRPISYSQAKSHIEKVFPYEHPFSLGEAGTLLELLKRPEVSLNKLKKVDQDGQSMVKVVFEEAVTARDGATATEETAWALLSPSEGWALREYSKTVGRGSQQMTYRGTLSYAPAKNGPPALVRMENWREAGASRTCVMHEVITINKFTAGDPAAIAFTADGFLP